jgi:peptidoglycan glycosyltransferase
MQTSLARRQRQRRNGAARRPRGGSAARRVAVAIPLFLFTTLLLVGVVSFVSVVSAYAYFSRGLPDPKELLLNLSFDQQTIVYDRTGTVELARLGEQKRELVTYDELPEELIDATTAIEDKDFWSNPGFDMGGFVSATLDTIAGRPRGGSTITQQLVRNRLLPAEALEGSVYERKIREIIQSIRLTQEFEGEDGKRQILTAYLNQNFYGNQSYGVRAAAKSYFGKELADLTLAEAAILAAIPQSPTRFDLVKNADIQCQVAIGENEECPTGQGVLVVPSTSEIVKRRNVVLDFMKTRSVLSGDRHTRAEYEAAKADPVVLAQQGAKPWKAAHFVWQVREQLADILCPGETADFCGKVDTGGFKVTTSLNWDMQVIAEKWVYSAARVVNQSDPEAKLAARGVDPKHFDWLLGLRGKNLNNGATAVTDYRTGEVLAYVGSAAYSATGSPTFQPQFDVLADGWRQPGSSIKPLNYIVGLDDRTMTAATMFMDVVTDFGANGQRYTPTQADGLERGPVRLRGALQFSLNIPSLKAGLINGLDHFLARTREFGLTYQTGTIPVVSMGIGTLEVHPIELLGGYGAIANGGVLMPRTLVTRIVDSKGVQVWPAAGAVERGKRVASAQAAYITTDIMAGSTDPQVNPYWGEWAIYDGDTRRPAAYKTGTTNLNRDVHAYGYLAPPVDPTQPALAVGVWMGNSNNDPVQDTLSLGSSAPLWSAILTEISAGLPIAAFEDSMPDGLVIAEVDAISGLLPGPFTTRTVKELFIDGTVPTRQDDLRVALDIDGATGLLWQEGCTGPIVTQGFLDFSGVEPAFPQWAPYTQGWVARAAQGTGVSGGPEGTRTTIFYNNAFAPFGRGWGGTFAPTTVCQPLPPPTCAPLEPFPPVIDPNLPVLPLPEPTPCITPEPPPPDGGGGDGGGGGGGGDSGGGSGGPGGGGGRPSPKP